MFKPQTPAHDIVRSRPFRSHGFMGAQQFTLDSLFDVKGNTLLHRKGTILRYDTIYNTPNPTIFSYVLR